MGYSVFRRMIFFDSRFFLLFVLLPSLLVARQIEVHREDSLAFPLKDSLLDRGDIQFYYEVIDRDESAMCDADYRTVSPLDRSGVYEPNRHHVVIARSAYVVDRSIEFFSEERLTDVEYIDEVTGFDDFVRPSGYPLNVIRKKGEFFVPSMDFVIRTYKPGALGSRSDRDRRFYERVLALEGRPSAPAITLEYDYRNFGKVFFAEIIAGARTVVHHYPYEDGRTLVVCTMLNFLYRLPPSLRVMENETRERAIDLILRTEQYRVTAG